MKGCLVKTNPVATIEALNARDYRLLDAKAQRSFLTLGLFIVTLDCKNSEPRVKRYHEREVEGKGMELECVLRKT
jgi:hypothetical protein